ncbi:MAG: hypothetical protein L0332_05460 [Chloroflexi bacterium]|nr:hypothetical protein [Chloroflexota bacterium]MCI0579910.1 hypothetical protein [Chloroflexota bacterium]MCI0646493.1 hypothetical protein [Chloroflexota bacterium]MCI0726155.1 hypothetical protein [Chloroflexota bacterium]
MDEWPVTRGRRKARILDLWREHGLPTAVYFALSVGLTWPMVARFTAQIVGKYNDAHNGLWVMWHTKEALLGRQPLFDLPILYYPEGATLLTHIPGPLTGFFALPFWPWGPEAAHNGAVLVSFVLTGYLMYRLARAFQLERPIAFFAGLMLLMAPMHLVGLWGHTTKVFLGAAPLALLGLHHALNPARSAWWSVVAGFGLLLALLHDSFQFILAGMGMAFFILAVFVEAWQSGRPLPVRRTLAVLANSILIAGPLFLAMAAAAFDPALDLNRNFDSFTFQPDLVEFLLPSGFSRLFGPFTARFFASHHIINGLESAVFLSWVALFLSAIALIKGPRPARLWLLFTAIWVVLSLGPSLKFLGRLTFTEYHLPIILPYAFLTALPGLDFLRTPGRFMQIGFVGLGMTAAFGLAWLAQRFPRYALAVVAAAILFLLLESWPQPWPHLGLRTVPAFYEQIAQDEEHYGVLDLPLAPSPTTAAIVYDTHYQMYQMTHHKGIAMGYLSRTYYTHPVFPCLIPELATTPDVTVNGRPVPCYRNGLYDLSRLNYRYVVWHKAQPWYEDYRPGSWGEQAAAEYIEVLFAGQAPSVEDELVRVYAVPAEVDPSQLTTAVALQENWYLLDDTPGQRLRWARSPATLTIYSPRPQRATLEIVPFHIYVPGTGTFLGDEGVLVVETENGATVTVTIHPNESVAIPLELVAGAQWVTLALQAGNFKPSDYGEADWRPLSFAIRSLNLRTTP